MPSLPIRSCICQCSSVLGRFECVIECRELREYLGQTGETETEMFGPHALDSAGAWPRIQASIVLACCTGDSDDG